MQELCSYGCTAYEYNHNHHTCTRLRLWCDDGITVWNEETMSNERVHIEIFWASMKCWCLTCAVRTLQHILASAAVGSNKLLSVYLCCKMIEKTTFTVRCFFLGLPHFFLELVVACTCFSPHSITRLKNLRAINFGCQFFCKYHRNWKHSFAVCKTSYRIC